MITEMRTYRTKPGKRPEFLKIFRTRSMPAHAEIGMPIAGPYACVDDPDVFFFMRSFADQDSRAAKKAAFYEGELWTTELDQILMPMLETYTVAVVDAEVRPPGDSTGTVPNVPEATETPNRARRDGSRDFDFELGDWTTHVARLDRPLSESTTWLEYDGTSRVRPILGGRANVVELDVHGPAGRIEGAAFRLYEPATGRWSLNFFSVADGVLTAPVFGDFGSGDGVFQGTDTWGGQPILVRFVITKVIDDTYRFEQAFSADDGNTWEPNWVATDTRIGAAAATSTTWRPTPTWG